MRRHQGSFLYSPSDLVIFLGCRHALVLNRRAKDEPLQRNADSPSQLLLQAKGEEHEKAYLEDLREQGVKVVSIPDEASLDARVAMTAEAMRQGAEAIYQGALMHGSWHGFADFLLRVDTPSLLGEWSYEAVDTKFAQSVKPSHVVQLAVYSDLLVAVQGVLPAFMSVALGNGITERLTVNDFIHYVRLAARRMEEFLSSGNMAGATKPDPCVACGLCCWSERCEAEWVAEDSLCLVANIRRSQREKLMAAGIGTLEALARSSDRLEVKGLVPESLAKLRRQARLQLQARQSGKRIHELLPLEEGRGFNRLPQPALGDLFFDMEGDPLYRDPAEGDNGLEYLFGVGWIDGDRFEYRAFWAHDREGEKRALLGFLDFVRTHLSAHPQAHIYHYNHYEVSALRRLSIGHAAGEDTVDDLLREGRFVDLFKVVREGLAISEPRYSLKNVEKFYMDDRGGAVTTSADSVVAYELWRATGDENTLREIEAYNIDDCRSTAMLRDWLLSSRPGSAVWLAPPEPREKERSDEEEAADRDWAELREKVLGLAPGVDKAVAILALELAGFHRREQKPAWWALFDRKDSDPVEILEDADCLGCLRLLGTPSLDNRSFVYTYRFPEQETKLRKGDTPTVLADMRKAGTIVGMDLRRRIISIKCAKAKGELPNEMDLGPSMPLDDRVLQGSLKRLAASIAKGTGAFPALEGLLRRNPPRLKGYAPGQALVIPGNDLVRGTIDVVGAMDKTHLVIQGPPGTGKTYTCSRVIVEMMRRGAKVGVASNSHKAIHNVLRGVEKAAEEQGFHFIGYKKCSANNPESVFGGRVIENVAGAGDIPLDAQLQAGTAWLFARIDRMRSLDYLFVDEAGQVSLANLAAMGLAAKNIVLVGDQMQLGQPIKAAHPDETGLSVLDYLLPGASTVPPDQGILLDLTWRMHPDLCSWVSEAFYDGRLQAEDATAAQSILLKSDANPWLRPTGLSFCSVEHSGRSQSCPEEVAEVVSIWQSLMEQRWRDRLGKVRTIGPDDVLVVAPYNVQVNALQAALPKEARVGTVDKFQGQEAAAVIVSMTTSSGEDMPRNAEFLFSRNRLNVAVSRARCLAVVVASPRLMELHCSRIEDMRRVNALCHAFAWSEATARRRDG